ncbi:MAG: SUMF1/EgtB/PvdO family nonheme iron enzyme [Candidatus Delongbacteria bacterium]|nr:SUMF1/EgtB/PvdO family nonheme iron enzyme [Candidatus Delongbacteria bacterium]
MKSFLNRIHLPVFILLILVLPDCSKNKSTTSSDGETDYQPQYISVTPGQSDTVNYYGSLILIFDHSQIADSLILKIEKVDPSGSLPGEWSSSLISFQVTLFHQDTSLYPDFAVPVEVHVIPSKIKSNLNVYQLGLAKISQDSVSSLETLINRRYKSVWSKVNGLSGTYSLGLLKEVADSLKNGVAIDLPVTTNGLPALPNYSFPEDVPLFYCYNLYTIENPKKISMPLILSKHSGICLPSVILNFSTHSSSRDMDKLWSDAAERTSHIQLILSKLSEFGSSNFDGISLNYFHVVTSDRIPQYFEFLDELSLRFSEVYPDKKLIPSLPYEYMDQLVDVAFWDRIDHLNLQVFPLQTGETGRNTLKSLDYETIEEKIFSLQSRIPFRKLYWEINPQIVVTSSDSAMVYSPSSLFELSGISLNQPNVVAGDALRLLSNLDYYTNSYAASACILEWDKHKLLFSLQPKDAASVYFSTELSLDCLIEFCQKMNMGGIHLISLESDDRWDMASRLRNYFYNRFYTLATLSKKSYQFTARTHQRVYDTLWAVKDTLAQEVILYSDQDYDYIVQDGMKRGDSLKVILSFNLSDNYVIVDTLAVFNRNGKPRFDYIPSYSVNTHSELQDTIRCIDPDQDSISVQVIDPAGSASVEEKDDYWVLRWKLNGSSQAGHMIDFHLKVSDSVSSRDLEFSVLLTEQQEKDVTADNGTILHVVSPEMIYLPKAKTIIGNDTAFQVVQWDSSYSNQILVLKPKQVEFLVYTRFLKDQPAWIVKKHDPAAMKFYRDTAAYSAGDVIFQGLATDYSSRDETPMEYGDQGDFYAGIYEVSNREYLNFVLDNGYQEQRYWSETGWQVRQQNGWNQPMGWNSMDYYGQSMSPLAEGPAVGLSYYEADAYAKWLSEKLQADYRIPTESEWERIAAGPAYADTLIQSDFAVSYPFRPYPWGYTFYPSYLVCSSETDTAKAEASDSRLSGRSIDGVCHLLGNALEWTSTYYNYPRSNQVSTRMVLKGGGFLFKNYTDIFHNKVRFRYGPEQRRKDSGFRLIRRP